MRERTPIDQYRERHAKNIYIELSRKMRVAAEYSLSIKGLERDFNFKSLKRETALEMIKDIHNMYREYNIIYNNSNTRTIIRDWMLYKITSIENTERSRDRTIESAKRDLNRFGRTPSILRGRRKPTDSKTMPPIEKTW